MQENGKQDVDYFNECMWFIAFILIFGSCVSVLVIGVFIYLLFRLVL